MARLDRKGLLTRRREGKTDIYSAALQFKALPGPKSSTGLQVVAAIGGGLLVTAVVLLLASVLSTRRRAATASP